MRVSFEVAVAVLGSVWALWAIPLGMGAVDGVSVTFTAWLWLFATSVVSVAIGTAVGHQRLGKPLRELITHLPQLELPSTYARLQWQRRDEVGEVAAAIDRLARILRISELEQETRTHTRITAIEQLRHADRLISVGTLAAGVAHELGTPMTVIQAHASQIQRGVIEGEAVKAQAKVIEEQTRRMASIVRRLLDFSRPNTGTRARASLRQLASDTLSLLRPIVTDSNVRLQLEIQSADAVGWIDQGQLQQVLLNLVMNALHAMKDGGTVTVVVGTSTVPQPTTGTLLPTVWMAVKDTGPGIPARHLHHVFDPFFTTKSVGEGTGLGLFVSWSIVSDHGGWIDVQSQPGQGACFTVYLPKPSAVRAHPQQRLHADHRRQDVTT